jgi:ketosteroid isomerase-like protein
MKGFTLLLAVFLLCHFGVAAQVDLQKMVDTEHAFAQSAAANGTRAAFLEFMADDAVVFNPDVTKAKPFWTARAASPSLLSWAPNYADISSNGVLGYTTGNWDYRAKGKDDAPGAFGDFITLWLRQPDGKYKWVVDIGVSHDKPEKYSTDWKTAAADTKASSVSPGEVAAGFYLMATARGLPKTYKTYAADDIRSYREGKPPHVGKKAVLDLLGDEKSQVTFAKRSSTLTAGDLSYTLSTYTRTEGGKVIEKGNFLQIWKFVDGKWRIVLDIFKPVK